MFLPLHQITEFRYSSLPLLMRSLIISLRQHCLQPAAYTGRVDLWRGLLSIYPVKHAILGQRWSIIVWSNGSTHVSTLTILLHVCRVSDEFHSQKVLQLVCWISTLSTCCVSGGKAHAAPACPAVPKRVQEGVCHKFRLQPAQLPPFCHTLGLFLCLYFFRCHCCHESHL